tara:strand:- start:4814 stop:5326 length:513 start_codon:yes stop_codon:yes gene_type:complete
MNSKKIYIDTSISIISGSKTPSFGGADIGISKREIFVDPSLNPDNNLFKFNFLLDVMNWNHKKFGWKKDYKKSNFPTCLNSMVKEMYNKYGSLTYGEVQNKKNCGKHRNINKKQKEVLSTVPRRCDFDGLENIFHIHLPSHGNKHCIYGYIENSVFYPVLNDKKHGFSNL